MLGFGGSKREKCPKFQKVGIWEIVFFKDDSTLVLAFPEVFVRSKGGVKVHYGSKKNQDVGNSRNNLKSVAICPGTLISHFGMK